MFCVSESLDTRAARGWHADAVFHDRRAAVTYATALVQDHLSAGSYVSGFTDVNDLAALRMAHKLLEPGAQGGSAVWLTLPSLHSGGCVQCVPVCPDYSTCPKRESPPSSPHQSWPEQYHEFWESPTAQDARGYSVSGVFRTLSGQRRWLSSCLQYWWGRGARKYHESYTAANGEIPTTIGGLSALIWAVGEAPEINLFGPPPVGYLGRLYGETRKWEYRSLAMALARLT